MCFYNPNSTIDCVKHRLKEWDIFLNMFDIYTIENSTNTICLMFYLISITIFCKYMYILNLLAAKHYKQVGTGAKKDWKSSGMLQKNILDNFLKYSTGSLVKGNRI